ncbi:hypothetical protein LSAT2_028145, partial [Lamellibrachia satsuma]
MVCAVNHRHIYRRNPAETTSHSLNVALSKACKARGPEVQNTKMQTLAVFFKFSPNSRRRPKQSTKEMNIRGSVKKWRPAKHVIAQNIPSRLAALSSVDGNKRDAELVLTTDQTRDESWNEASQANYHRVDRANIIQLIAPIHPVTGNVVSAKSPINNVGAVSRVVVPVKLVIVNARSVCNKTDVFTDHLTEVNMDFVAITGQASYNEKLINAKQCRVADRPLVPRYNEKLINAKQCRVADRPLVPRYNEKLINAKQCRVADRPLVPRYNEKLINAKQCRVADRPLVPRYNEKLINAKQCRVADRPLV